MTLDWLTLSLFLLGCAVLAFVLWACMGGMISGAVQDALPKSAHKLYPWWRGGERAVVEAIKAAGEVTVVKPKRKPFARAACPICQRDMAVNSVGDPIRKHICTFGSPWQYKKAEKLEPLSVGVTVLSKSDIMPMLASAISTDTRGFYDPASEAAYTQADPFGIKPPAPPEEGKTA